MYLKHKRTADGKQVYSIGQFSKIVKRPTEKIRELDNKGIFLAVRLPPMDRRYYTEEKLTEYKVLFEATKDEHSTKVCCTCKLSKEISAFSKSKKAKDGLRRQCKACIRDYRIKTKEHRALYNHIYYSTEKGKRSQLLASKKYSKSEKFQKSQNKYINSEKGMCSRQNIIYKKAYGITREDKQRMYEQQGKQCAICSKPSTMNKLVVEHDHKTDLVRGLTCTACNMLLGMAHDNIGILNAAIEYLLTNSKILGGSYECSSL